MTLAHQAEFQRYSKKTRREQFLEEMDAVMPWAKLLALVAPRGLITLEHPVALGHIWAKS